MSRGDDQRRAARQGMRQGGLRCRVRYGRPVDLLRLSRRHAPLCTPATLGHTGDYGATNRIGIAELTDTAGVTGPALGPHISARIGSSRTNQG
jgi:hypothetical protein